MVSITFDWEIKNTNMGGIINNTVTAMALPERAIPPADIDDITWGNVLSSSLNMVPCGIIVHISWKDNNSIVIHAGFNMGITTLIYILGTPAPSILAASINASGTDTSIYCFIRKHPVALGIAGNIYTQYVSIICNFVYM